MLSALERTKANGGRIIAVNPLIEAGLKAFRNPQTVRGVLRGGVELADEYCQIRVNGDLAFFQGLNKLLLEADALDHPFIAEAHQRIRRVQGAHLDTIDWTDIERATGLSRADLERVAEQVQAAESIIVCWAMGLTQHKNSVPTIREIVNFLLLRGNRRPGAGACPVRGHSNVQGDRTVGINERPPAALLDALDRHFGIVSPRERGHDVVAAIRAMRDGRCVPGRRRKLRPGDSGFGGDRGRDAQRGADRPCLDQAERVARDHRTAGVDPAHPGPHRARPHERTGAVRHRRGLDGHGARLSRTAGLGDRRAAVRGRHRVLDRRTDGGFRRHRLGGDARRLRHHSRAHRGVHSGVRALRGAGEPPRWASRCRTLHVDPRTFKTSTGKARFTANELVIIEVPAGHLLLQTVRSHDQFNTTIYGMDDVYRGVKAGRRVLFIHPADRAELGFDEGAMVDLVSIWRSEPLINNVPTAAHSAGDLRPPAPTPDDPIRPQDPAAADHRSGARPRSEQHRSALPWGRGHRGALRPRLPAGRLRDRPRLRRGLLPGDERAGAP